MAKTKKTEREKMLSGEEYFSKDKDLAKSRKRSFENSIKYSATGETKYLEEVLQRKVENFTIHPPFCCDYGENIKIGKNVFINFNCSILSCGEVEIGDDCWIGPNVQIYTAIHPIEFEKRNTGIGSAKPVKIGKNCWLGGGVIILPNVEIGEGSVIGAGSVVTKNIPPNSVAVGNPCKVIRKIK